MISEQLRHHVASGLPPAVSRVGRRWLSRPRWWLQRLRARRGYRRHGHRYPLSHLFVAGLPKSGTSWLEGMLASLPGFHPVMPPEAVDHELREGGSHRLDLPPDLFEQLRGCLAVLKLHAHGSGANVRLLEREGLPWIVLFRDLRDVAVSHTFYVRRTPWHPEHPDYAGLDVRAGLRHFADTLLEPFVDWIRSWTRLADDRRVMTLRYEEMLDDTEAVLGRAFEHYGIDPAPGDVEEIVAAHSFARASGGRDRGEEDRSSFRRKGIAGDWRNYFDDTLTRVFREKAGAVLIDLGYEEGPDW